METLFLLAHLTASGIQFPSECCGGHDCYEISAQDLVEETNTWRILETGERFSKRDARESPDGSFYRCSAQANVKAPTICLFIPQWGS